MAQQDRALAVKPPWVLTLEPSWWKRTRRPQVVLPFPHTCCWLSLLHGDGRSCQVSGLKNYLGTQLWTCHEDVSREVKMRNECLPERSATQAEVWGWKNIKEEEADWVTHFPLLCFQVKWNFVFHFKFDTCNIWHKLITSKLSLAYWKLIFHWALWAVTHQTHEKGSVSHLG